MASLSPNLGLKLFSDSDGDTTFLSFYTGIAGTAQSSNFMILDAKYKEIMDTMADTPTSTIVYTKCKVDANNPSLYIASAAAIVEYLDNMFLIVSLDATNNGLMQININGLGPIYLMKYNTAGELTNLMAGELKANHSYLVRYDASTNYFVMLTAIDNEDIYVPGVQNNILIINGDQHVADSGIALNQLVRSVNGKSTENGAITLNYEDVGALAPVDGAVANNFAALDADGKLIDSGKNGDSFRSADWMPSAADVKADPEGSANTVQESVNAHVGNKENPHEVTAAQVGADPAGSANTVQTNLNTHTGNSTVHLPSNGILTVAKGGTGATTAAAALTALGAAASSHNQAASSITAGTLAGKVVANASAVATATNKQVRNIVMRTASSTSGLANGDILHVYS